MADVPTCFRDWLRGDLDMVANAGGAGTDGPEVVVIRVGGGRDRAVPAMDHALIQFDVWGGDSYSEVATRTSQIVTALEGLERTPVGTGLLCHGVAVLSELDRPDPEGDRPRRIVTARTTVLHREGD